MKRIRVVQQHILADIPPFGAVVTENDDRAAELVDSGFAVYEGEQPKEDWGFPDPDIIPVTEVPPVTEKPELIDSVQVREPSKETGLISEEAPEPLKRPYANAPKSSWVAWAVSQGADEDEASGLTKAELMSRYGERL